MALEIRYVKETDHPHWLEMFKQYCVFHDVPLTVDVTERAWERIFTPGTPLRALIALNEEGRALGICNYLCHEDTFSCKPMCYLADLYVDPESRGRGVGRALIAEVTRIGREEAWFRIYWITGEDNQPARVLYDAVARNTGHVRYDIALC
ncbi:MAG: GNAT family N-acetyltransferase [Janthinobacterium lividum]